MNIEQNLRTRRVHRTDLHERGGLVCERGEKEKVYLLERGAIERVHGEHTRFPNQEEFKTRDEPIGSIKKSKYTNQTCICTRHSGPNSKKLSEFDSEVS